MRKKIKSMVELKLIHRDWFEILRFDHKEATKGIVAWGHTRQRGLENRPEVGP